MLNVLTSARFAALGRLLRSYTFDAAKGINTGQWEGEYWMDE